MQYSQSDCQNYQRRSNRQYWIITGLIGCIAFPGKALAVDDLTDSRVNLGLRDGLLQEVRQALPEGRDANPAFLADSYDPNLYLTEDSQLSITFIDEGAGFRNSLGYFTFEDNSFDDLGFGDLDMDGSGRISIGELTTVDGVDAGLIFGNASKRWAGGILRAGDTVVLGGGTASLNESGDFQMTGGTVFDAGTNVGFFLGANAWTGSEVQGWDGAGGDPNVFYSIDSLNPEAGAGADDFFTRHVALGFLDDDRSELILGFEDLYRPYDSDEDFNDAVFMVRSDPIAAIQGTNVAVFTAPAPTMGGLAGGFGVLAFGAMAMIRRIRTKIAFCGGKWSMG